MIPNPRLHDPDPRAGDWLDVQLDELVERRRYPRKRRNRTALILAAIAGTVLVLLAGIQVGRATGHTGSGASEWQTVTIHEGGNEWTIKGSCARSPIAGTNGATTTVGTVPSDAWAGSVNAHAVARTLCSSRKTASPLSCGTCIWAGDDPGLILEPNPTLLPERPEVAQDGELVSVGTAVSGVASWYDDPRKSGIYAAAGPALRVGDWRGRTVTVCGAVCFQTVLSDWCLCPGGRVIDLSSGAFSRLSPLSKGLVSVTVG